MVKEAQERKGYCVLRCFSGHSKFYVTFLLKLWLEVNYGLLFECFCLKSKIQFTLGGLLSRLIWYKMMEKRWNGTFSSIGKALSKRL